jgi:hypothetical protein
MVIMKYKQSKPTIYLDTPNNFEPQYINNFKKVEAMGIKTIASRSPWMALPPYQISLNSTKPFKSY